jgi:hypothetical protein
MTTIDNIQIGASVSMTPPEADALAGNGPVRLVTCPNGRIIGGMGAVGLIEHVDETDLVQFIAEVNAKRKALADAAAAPQPENPRANLYTFIRI